MGDRPAGRSPTDQHARGGGRYAPAYCSKLAPVLGSPLPTFFCPRSRVLRSGRRPLGALLAVVVGLSLPFFCLPSAEPPPPPPPTGRPSPSHIANRDCAPVRGLFDSPRVFWRLVGGTYRPDAPGLSLFAKGTTLGSAAPARRGSVDAQITRASKKPWAPAPRKPLPARVRGETVSKRRRPLNALRVSCGAKLPEPPCRRRIGSARAAPAGLEEARETEAPRASRDLRRRFLRAQDRLPVTRPVELVLFKRNPQAQRRDGT